MCKWRRSSISLFGKNGRYKKHTHDSGGKENMGILFIQSYHTYCRISAGGFRYQGRQVFQVNKKFVKWMDIKQANISEIDTSFRTAGCGSVWIQVMPTDTKVNKLATRPTSIDERCISNKLDTPKSVHFPNFCFYKESVSKSNEEQMYIDHNNISVALKTIPHPVI